MNWDNRLFAYFQTVCDPLHVCVYVYLYMFVCVCVCVSVWVCVHVACERYCCMSSSINLTLIYLFILFETDSLIETGTHEI